MYINIVPGLVYPGFFRRYPIDFSGHYEAFFAGKFTYKEKDVSSENMPLFRRNDKHYLQEAYVSIFGPTFANIGREFRKSADNFNVALTRQICSHQNARTFRCNQLKFARTNLVNKFVVAYRLIVGKLFQLDIAEGMIRNAEKPHNKRKRRISSLGELHSEGKFHSNCILRKERRKVKGQIKTNETIPNSTRPRMTIDMSTPGSLVLGEIVDAIKTAFGEVIVGRCRLSFAMEPSNSEIARLLTRLIYPEYDVEYVYFSDDACVAFKDREGKWQRANVDIKSCDGSHSRAVFDMLVRIVGNNPSISKQVKLALSQLMCTLYIGYTGRHPKNSKKHRQTAFLEPVFPVLYSGSVLTTIINNIANCLIGLGIYKHRDVKLGAKDAGYEVKVVPVVKIEDYQFLKMSPFLTDLGQIGVFLNLGVILRLFGKIRGDLPGSGDVTRRAYRFNCQIMSGLRYSGDSSLYQLLCDKFPPQDLGLRIKLPGSLEIVKFNVTFKVPDRVLEARYGLGSYDEFLQLLRSAGPGSLISHKFVDTCMKIDYGYESPIVLDYRIQPQELVPTPTITYNEAI